MTTAQITIGQGNPTATNVYLFHPAVDLLLVCGGWLYLLIGINAWVGGGGAPGDTIPAPMRVLALIGTFVIAQPHSAATLFKLYGDGVSAKRLQLVSYALPAMLFVALLAGLKFPAIARLEATLYVGLALHHIMAQCYGIALMYCARAKTNVTPLERQTLKAMLWTTVAAAVTQQLSGSFVRHTFLGIALFQTDLIPMPVVTIFQAASVASFAALLFLQGQKFLRNQQIMPLPALLTLLASSLLLTVWNTAGEMIWLFVPPFFHGSQYLCVTMSYFIKKEKEQRGTSSKSAISEFALIRLAELFVVGLLLFVGVPKLLSLTGAPLALCTSLMFFSISLHHFAADACIWKLRDPKVQRSLSN